MSNSIISDTAILTTCTELCTELFFTRLVLQTKISVTFQICQNLYLSKVIKGGPIRYIATETKQVWFFNCKQTSNKSLRDGSHRDDEVQRHRFDGSGSCGSQGERRGVRWVQIN